MSWWRRLLSWLGFARPTAAPRLSELDPSNGPPPPRVPEPQARQPEPNARIPEPNGRIPKPKAPVSGSAGPTSPRRFALGLDWGTAHTKLVLRDADDRSAARGVAWVIEEAGTPLIPSDICLEGGRLWFGSEARARHGRSQQSWVHLKALTGVGGRWGDPAGIPGSTFTLADLAALALTRAARLGFEHATRIAAGKGQRALFALTVSVPDAQWEQPRERAGYLRVAATASRLCRTFDPQGCTVADAAARLGEADLQAHVKAVIADPKNLHRYLRAEVLAAMVWPFLSPRTEEGAYTVIDVGAATTNASFFRIHQRHLPDGSVQWKGAIAVFGVATARPGAEELALSIAEAVGQPPSAVRTQEDRWLARHEAAAAANPVLVGIHEVWAEARRNAWSLADRVEHYDGLRVLHIGGGARIRRVREVLTRPPGYLRDKIRCQVLPAMAAPSNLVGALTGAGVGRIAAEHADMLFVAYGLAFSPREIFEAALPDTIERPGGARATRPFVTFEELGYE